MTSLENWNRAATLYRCMRIYNTIFMNWMRVYAPPVIFSLCSGVVILLFPTARPSDLPFFIYIWLPVLAVLVILVLGQVWVDAVMARRNGDEVIANLQSRSSAFYQSLPLSEQRLLIRTSRAFRAVEISIGEFAENTIESFVATLDEILNQFLFLLSL